MTTIYVISETYSKFDGTTETYPTVAFNLMSDALEYMKLNDKEDCKLEIQPVQLI